MAKRKLKGRGLPKPTKASKGMKLGMPCCASCAGGGSCH